VDEDRVTGSAAVVYVGGCRAEDLDVVGGGLVAYPLPLIVLDSTVDQDAAGDERLVVLPGVVQLRCLGQVAGEGDGGGHGFLLGDCETLMGPAVT